VTVIVRKSSHHWWRTSAGNHYSWVIAYYSPLWFNSSMIQINLLNLMIAIIQMLFAYLKWKDFFSVHLSANSIKASHCLTQNSCRVHFLIQPTIPYCWFSWSSYWHFELLLLSHRSNSCWFATFAFSITTNSAALSYFQFPYLPCWSDLSSRGCYSDWLPQYWWH